MKKIFILTGEPSGDKLASKVITKLKNSRSDIEYLSVGGEHLNALGIKSLYDLKEITYLGFTRVLLNIFKIKSKINETVKEIIKFKPDILFSVDSPDFTLRVSKQVKKKVPSIKTIHFVAPQVLVWREYRVKHLKSFLDHILLLLPFEKKYFDKEGIQSTFTGHPLLEEGDKSKVDISQIIKDNKKIFSIYPGSRLSEINVLTPILFQFVNPKAWVICITAVSLFYPEKENLIFGTLFMVIMSTIINIPSISIWAFGGSVIRLYLTNSKLKKIIEFLLALLLIGTAISVFIYKI